MLVENVGGVVVELAADPIVDFLVLSFVAGKVVDDTIVEP